MSHIMGDGVALMRFVLEVMADNPRPHAAEWDFWKAEKTSKFNIKMFLLLIKLGTILFFVFPYYALCDIFRTSDQNFLHPKQLNGEKIMYWIHETDVDIPLLDTLKQIRRKYPGTRFNDVLLMLATKGIAKVFAARDQSAPNVQCVLAERIVSEGEILSWFCCSYSHLKI